MSPRSDEYLHIARRRLTAARATVDVDPGSAISTAYYAALNAARAALSERDRFARTHGGTWSAFHAEWVATGLVAPERHAEAARLQEPREAADYEAATPSSEEAEAALAAAQRFVAAVEAALRA